MSTACSLGSGVDSGRNFLSSLARARRTPPLGARARPLASSLARRGLLGQKRVILGSVVQLGRHRVTCVCERDTLTVAGAHALFVGEGGLKTAGDRVRVRGEATGARVSEQEDQQSSRMASRMTAAPFRIEVDATSLRRSQGGLITGTVAIRVGGRHFPDHEWSDFVVVVLGWWCSEFAKLMNRRRGEGVFAFMDGPYEVRVSLAEAGIVGVEFFRDDRPVGGRMLATLEAVQRAMMSASRQVLDACRAREWDEADVRTLDRALKLIVQ